MNQGVWIRLTADSSNLWKPEGSGLHIQTPKRKEKDLKENAIRNCLPKNN